MTVDPIAADAFDAMAEDYERGRPGWPAETITELLERFGARTVLDLAVRTGKLTEVLAGRAEAFHWFDPERAPAEIARVLRPDGGLAVMWNVSHGDDPAWMTDVLEVVVARTREGSGERRVDG